MPRLILSHRAGWAGLSVLCVLLLIGCQSQPQSAPLTKDNQFYVKAAVAYNDGDRDRAIAALRAALEENPDLIMARFLLGSIHRDSGDYSAAADQYKRVCELDPYSYSNFYNLGLMYHLLNRLQEAAVTYLQALKLNPLDVKSNMNLGMTYTALGNPELGLPYVRKATEIDNRAPEAFANLAVVLDTLGRYSEAELAYRRALELDSDRIDTAINLAGCLAAQKRVGEAIAVYEEILRKKDSSLLRQRYGNALVQAGRFDDAVREFNLALKLNANNHQAYNGLGDAMIGKYRQSSMLDEKARAEAIRYWKKSLEISPSQPRISALLIEYAGNSLFP